MSLTITIRQLLDLVAMAGYDTNTLHTQTEPDEFDTELTIEPCPPKGIMDDDGKPLHYSLIAYFTEYPEEGALGLGEAIIRIDSPGQSENSPKNETSAPAIVFFPAGSLGEEISP